MIKTYCLELQERFFGLSKYVNISEGENSKRECVSVIPIKVNDRTLEHRHFNVKKAAHQGWVDFVCPVMLTVA
jgi:hypothetical protein